MKYEEIKLFIIQVANDLLQADINEERKCEIPIFSDETLLTPWGVIHIIDEVNKEYHFIFNVSEITSNPLFSLNDLAESIHKQLLLE